MTFFWFRSKQKGHLKYFLFFKESTSTEVTSVSLLFGKDLGQFDLVVAWLGVRVIHSYVFPHVIYFTEYLVVSLLFCSIPSSSNPNKSSKEILLELLLWSMSMLETMEESESTSCSFLFFHISFLLRCSWWPFSFLVFFYLYNFVHALFISNYLACHRDHPRLLDGWHWTSASCMQNCLLKMLE